MPTEPANVCYRIERPHDPSDARPVRNDNPDLGINQPLQVASASPRNAAAGSWVELVKGKTG
jgi:dTDP-4-dehydrorhamnose 3,5-epimerase